MICKRCGSECPERERGYCLHCQIAVDLEAKMGKMLEEVGVQEGFPDWQEPEITRGRRATNDRDK